MKRVRLEGLVPLLRMPLMLLVLANFASVTQFLTALMNASPVAVSVGIARVETKAVALVLSLAFLITLPKSCFLIANLNISALSENFMYKSATKEAAPAGSVRAVLYL